MLEMIHTAERGLRKLLAWLAEQELHELLINQLHRVRHWVAKVIIRAGNVELTERLAYVALLEERKGVLRHLEVGGGSFGRRAVAAEQPVF